MFQISKKTKTFALAASVLTVFLSLSYLVSAWVGPLSTPPVGDALWSAPINVSNTTQWKEGALGIGSASAPFTLATGAMAASSFYDRDNSDYFLDPSAEISANLAGAVRISDTTSACEVAVRGTIKFAAGVAGAADKIYQCLKDEADEYTWTEIAKQAIEAGATAPSQVTGLSATAGDTQVVLNWTAPSDGGSAITSYKVYRSTTSGTETLFTTLGNVITYTNTSLTNGITYYYKVSAVNGVGEGSQSGEANAIPVTNPSQVTGLSATAGNTQIVLNWSAPLSDGGNAITAYKVYRSTTSGTETLFTTLGNVTTYTNTSLTNGITYYYKVSAVNLVGEGSQSDEVNTMPADTLLTWPGSTHYVSQCLTIGGTIYNTGSGTICEYSGASVPSGWTQAANWQRYSVSSWGTGDSCGTHFSTGPITWSNTAAADRSAGAWINAYDRGQGCQCPNYWRTLTSQSASCSGIDEVNNPPTNRVEVGIY